MIKRRNDNNEEKKVDREEEREEDEREDEEDTDNNNKEEEEKKEEQEAPAVIQGSNQPSPNQDSTATQHTTSWTVSNKGTVAITGEGRSPLILLGRERERGRLR